ncbi:uncharacterized protein LOC142332210 isoform X1 [Lycorma delicatula]|uniref:uncharacterized protein LOC142332210 isoform X1 n=1 Tax=Lycorma delicatula TaxID=130591 RepID=UPI003F514F9F
MDAQTNDSVLEENPLSLPIKKEDMHETGQQEYLFVHLAKTDAELTIFKQSMDAQTDSSFFDEDPLSSSIKKKIKYETERTEHLIAPVAMTEDKLSTSRQRMDAQTDSSFFDEDPLSSSIKKEIKHETERTEHLIAPVAMTDDKPTSRKDLVEEVINDVEERITESHLQTSKCVVCNKLKYKCVCDNVIDEEYNEFNCFSFKEKCLQITEKPDKERNVFSSSYSHVFFVRSLSLRDLL